MRSFLLGTAMLALTAPTARGDLNLGMLLHCKKYGEAFNGCDRVGIMGACTPEFAAQWGRLPPEVLAKLPRGGANAVMHTARCGAGGAVCVKTKLGVTTFVLLQDAHGWKVADIFKTVDGEQQSVKGYLDVTLTANEFICKLKRQGGASFHDRVTPGFRQAFERYCSQDVDRIREFLPNPKVAGLPQVKLGDRRATVRCRMPSGASDDAVTFFLTNDNGWKVDDFALESRTTTIRSFRDSLPILVAATSFGDFAKEPACGQPERFAAPGKLLEALEYSKELHPSPFPSGGKPLSFRVAEDCLSAELSFPDRQVRMSLAPAGPHAGMLESVAVRMGGSWTAVADLILMKRNFSRIASTTGWFGGPQTSKALKPLPKPDPQLQNAASAEPPRAGGDNVLQFASGTTATAAEPDVRPVARVHVASLQRTKREPVRGIPYRLTAQQMVQQTAKGHKKR